MEFYASWILLVSDQLVPGLAGGKIQSPIPEIINLRLKKGNSQGLEKMHEIAFQSTDHIDTACPRFQILAFYPFHIMYD